MYDIVDNPELHINDIIPAFEKLKISNDPIDERLIQMLDSDILETLENKKLPPDLLPFLDFWILII